MRHEDATWFSLVSLSWMGWKRRGRLESVTSPEESKADMEFRVLGKWPESGDTRQKAKTATAELTDVQTLRRDRGFGNGKRGGGGKQSGTGSRSLAI